MELSQEIQTILQKYRPQKIHRPTSDEELIDVADMDFDNETWLVGSEPVPDLSNFFKCETDMMTSSDSDTSTRTFDSRTFTRPKRNLNRPSIEKYNEEFFGVSRNANAKGHKHSLSEEIDNYMAISSTTLEDGMTESQKSVPVQFDLTQPISSSIFENIASRSAELDSFQNMSPPSLVNSMCSSTFTNLMENSFIKNDPVLREIRDADYSSVIYQEIEPPLYQSITESCSSINTEVAETFVRKTLNSLNCTFNNKLSLEQTKYAQEDSEHTRHAENIDPNATYSALSTFNNTYRKNKSDHILNATFELDQNDANNKTQTNDLNSTFSLQETKGITLNSTFKRTKSPKRASLNSTFNKNVEEHTNLGNTLTLAPQIDNYMIDESTIDNKTKRLSDDIDEYLKQKISMYSEAEDNLLMHHSAKSTDSIDRLSSISSSSRESKLMAEVDAIVERQERSLQQVMSTPKPTKTLHAQRTFDLVQLSPIPNLNLNEHLSDSEVSSGEYNTVRSRFSEMNSGKTWSKSRSGDAINRKSIHTLSDIQKPASGLRRPSTAGNVSSLRKESKISGSYGNLNKLSTKLGGSYTNLRPKSMILPSAPTRGEAGDTFVAREEFKVPQVPARMGEHRGTGANPNGTFVKPAGTNLPRPTGTGIPRPTSKIPGPRTSRLPLSRSKTNSRTNLNDANY